MIIIPAIDILSGGCVRLHQGAYDRAKRYDEDPVSVARTFETAGATRIHVVDLDAARGSGHNRSTISKICEAVSAEIEVGGGVRTLDDVEALFAAGVDRLIVGTALVRDPQAVSGWLDQRGGRFTAGIDARDGVVRISGWEQASDLHDVDLAVTAAEMGFGEIVYTNIAVDGTLEGPDIDGTNRIARASGLPVILSGGVGSIEDVERVVEAADPGVAGIITGKALYEGALDLETAIKRTGERRR